MKRALLAVTLIVVAARMMKGPYKLCGTAGAVACVMSQLTRGLRCRIELWMFLKLERGLPNGRRVVGSGEEVP